VELVDYLLSYQCVIGLFFLGLWVVVLRCANQCRGGRLRKEAGGN